MPNLVRDFTLPRERVPKEVSRAFQAVQISLKNLERAVEGVAPSDAEAVSALRTEVTALERAPKFARPDPKAVVSRSPSVTPTPPPDPEIIFSSRIR